MPVKNRIPGHCLFKMSFLKNYFSPKARARLAEGLGGTGAFEGEFEGAKPPQDSQGFFGGRSPPFHWKTKGLSLENYWVICNAQFAVFSDWEHLVWYV